MLRFFRQIRQKLIEQENMRKYVWYALGEILLVVIGILIALQINNWNEQRIDQNYETTILLQIKESLQNDVEYSKNQLARISRKREAANFILDTKSDQVEISDTLFTEKAGQLSLTISMKFNKASYEALKSIGLDKIRDNELRLNITNFYEVEIPQHLEIFEEPVFEGRNTAIFFQLIDENIIRTEFQKDSLNWKVGGTYDAGKMINDNRYMELVRNEITMMGIYEYKFNAIKEDAVELSSEIDSYLEIN